MRLLYGLLVIIFSIDSCKFNKSAPPGFVFVKGGFTKNIKSNLYNSSVLIRDFYISKYEVTQKEWWEVMGYNPSGFKGDSLPVESINWYESIEYCNKRSLKEGLEPVYLLDKMKKDTDNKSEFDSLKYTVKVRKNANGYRLPTELEWEYAASGGQESLNYSYSGSDDINEVAWFWKNSGNKELKGEWSWMILENNRCSTKKIGVKKPNELGVYDMSGNVREWCEDWYQDYQTPMGLLRSQRGGGWMGADSRCQIFNRHSFEASGKGTDQGLRLCRSVL
ncbi:protein of unknown function DUF323 [Pseudopedobacter saltans DSM 12145]|uniref:Sulfatase-modifying factor enzyme-like domain-containing protein n=1 Tax=Pseudopedobacter saltans (strain ATCC 51119 / DSM 12145 / JCM 21818 / CCUG 39354 / LMG 10337 / NBRC 100064 / NCIMB 13643) TaxID=762903 RepID=F0S4S9_PSESL|nr:formylglycine-generating enzyme family protein [Pseudopedobacter saltans]ADY53097.1 protein of unknown function DUF323 [Pseudopedobacter saltans DSM 12145]